MIVKIPSQSCKAYWIVPPVRRVTNCADIIERAADYFGVKSKDMMTQKRTRELAYPRMMIMHVLYYNTKIKPTMKYIGKLFNRDHTTVLNALRQIENFSQTDDKFTKRLRDFHDHIYGHLDYFHLGVKEKKQIIKI